MQWFNHHRWVMHHREYDSTCLRSDISIPWVLLHLLLFWYIHKTYNKITPKGNPKYDHSHCSYHPIETAPTAVIHPSTNPLFSMLMTLVILVILVLLLLRLRLRLGTGWLLLAMADPHIGRIAEIHMLASVAATKLLRQLTDVSGCSISSSGTYSQKS